MASAENLVLSGRIERIGLHAATFKAGGADGAPLPINMQSTDLPNHEAAFKVLFTWLQQQAAAKNLDAVGHRVVHGGAKYSHPQRITTELAADLEKLVPLDPEHLPHEIKAMEAIGRLFPALTQVACFDTAFHHDMPRLAQIYPLPRQFESEGMRRYGFHGLSYEFIMDELRRTAGAAVADGRVVVAHLGNGASMAAVRHGQSVDTTMGLTPTGGLVMSTRTGDLDPAVILYLLREKGLTVHAVNDLVNRQAGLLGVSGTSSDMADLLTCEAKDPHAAEAVGLFCYQAKKLLAGLVAVLGGLDTLIFTAGIGENAPAIRARICSDLAFLGIQVDPSRNNANAPIISPDDGAVVVRVMKTNEELMIARHTRRVAIGQ
jgi:acetate kinase